jgi:hypothetical protein
MKRRLLPLALLAALLASIPPAAADDAGDFFALFDRTCAKSLTDQQAFIEAAKGAGATFRFANSGRSEAQMAHALGDTSYWVMDDRPRGLTLSMTAIGSAAKHSLSCIVYAPPRAGLTLDGAITHIRAMMGMGEPVDRHEASPARPSGASWLIGPALDQQRIGIDIASADSDAMSSIAVITPQHAQTQSPAALALNAAVAQLKRTLPRDLNDSVTATDVRAEDMTIVYVLDIKSGHEIPDMKPVQKAVQKAMTEKLCASPMRATIEAGASVTYEYWTPGPTRILRGKFNISACP